MTRTTTAHLPGEGRPGLRQLLLGTWHLLSYEEQSAEAPPSRPFGPDVSGLLTYTPDGCVSVLMMPAGRAPFSSGDWFRPTPEEAIAAAASFIAYSGGFTVDEAARTVTHAISVSFFPNWVGNRQVRRAELEGNDLTLTPTVPIMSGGQSAIPRVRWRRASALPGA